MVQEPGRVGVWGCGWERRRGLGGWQGLLSSEALPSERRGFILSLSQGGNRTEGGSMLCELDLAKSIRKIFLIGHVLMKGANCLMKQERLLVSLRGDWTRF